MNIDSSRPAEMFDDFLARDIAELDAFMRAEFWSDFHSKTDRYHRDHADYET
ncbi:MAG: hypothetical protein WD795_16505 [Woeseia sp.]